MNVFYNAIIFVKDMQKTRFFYETILGLKIEVDYEVFLIYENRLAIHDGKVLRCYDPDRHIVEIGEPLHLEYLRK